MLVCAVSARPRSRAIAVDLAETAAADDASTTGTAVFATLVDDPASVADIVDAYLGEIMVEAASVADALDAGLSLDLAIIEAASASDTTNAAIPTSTTTWNPSDISTYSGSGWPTFSNGNLTVASSAGNNQAVRSTQAATGKRYMEFVHGSLGGACFSGIAGGSETMFNVALALSNTAVAGTDGTIRVNGAATGSFSTATVGQTICVAVDIASMKIWARVNGGDWNGSSSNNPATGVGGVDFSAVSLAGGAMSVWISTFTSTNVTANFGASAFLQAPPSGFTAWP